MKLEELTFKVFWSDEDEECVAIAEEYPTISNLDEDVKKAFVGLIELWTDIIQDETFGWTKEGQESEAQR